MLVLETSMQCLQNLCCAKCLCTVNVMCIVCVLRQPAFHFHGFGRCFAHSYFTCYVGHHSDHHALATEKQTCQECVIADNVLLY